MRKSKKRHPAAKRNRGKSSQVGGLARSRRLERERAIVAEAAAAFALPPPPFTTPPTPSLPPRAPLMDAPDAAAFGTVADPFAEPWGSSPTVPSPLGNSETPEDPSDGLEEGGSETPEDPSDELDEVDSETPEGRFGLVGTLDRWRAGTKRLIASAVAGMWMRRGKALLVALTLLTLTTATVASVALVRACDRRLAPPTEDDAARPGPCSDDAASCVARA